MTATVGSVSGSSDFTVTNYAPSVVNAAQATPGAVAGTTTEVSVLGADVDTGEASLTYTWSVVGNPPAGVTFDNNDTNAAKNVTATFTKAGTYSFLVTITDPGGSTATSSVTVTVAQTLSTIAITPGSVSLNAHGMRQFSAIANDQFGDALDAQPTFAWTTTAGSITSAGLLTASETSAVGTVTATVGSASGSSDFTVTNHAPLVVNPAQATPGAVLGTTTDLSVLGGDVDTGEASLAYTWSVLEIHRPA